MSSLIANASDLDVKMMRTAVLLGERARAHAPPNPWVGCVVAQGDIIVGEGWTQPPGGNHAEVEALDKAGGCAEGSTVYTTLEPCSHFGRTAPCVEALIHARVGRVIVGLQDPDLNVCGEGIRVLRAAGIKVEVGLEAELCALSLEPYIKHRLTGLPYVVLKTAMSVDGRIAMESGESQWITCQEARVDVHAWRDECQAILIGSGTALADNPSLTVRHVEPMAVKPPRRVLLDRSGRVPAKGALFKNTKETPTTVYTTEAAPAAQRKAWEKKGAEVIIIPPEHNFLWAVLENLGTRNHVQVMVESGPTLLTSFVEEEKFDKLLVYVGPKLLGPSGVPVYFGKGPDSLNDNPLLQLQHCRRIGQTCMMEYRRHMEMPIPETVDEDLPF